MNINTAQIKAIRLLISKTDKEHVANKTERSVRTVEAVLNGDRVSDEIERELFKIARMNHAHISRVISSIESQNLLSITQEDFEKIKSSPQWVNDDTYQRYNDIYLRLCSFSYSEMQEVWGELKKDFKDIICRPYYCCDLLTRLTGSNTKDAVNFYNINI